MSRFTRLIHFTGGERGQSYYADLGDQSEVPDRGAVMMAYVSLEDLTTDTNMQEVKLEKVNQHFRYLVSRLGINEHVVTLSAAQQKPANLLYRSQPL